MSYPVLAFHGTKENNIHSICNTGFRVPGEENFEHATDTGKIISFLLKSHLRSKDILNLGLKWTLLALFFLTVVIIMTEQSIFNQLYLLIVKVNKHLVGPCITKI